MFSSLDFYIVKRFFLKLAISPTVAGCDRVAKKQVARRRAFLVTHREWPPNPNPDSIHLVVWRTLKASNRAVLCRAVPRDPYPCSYLNSIRLRACVRL